MYIVSARYNDSDTDTSRTKRAALIANSRRIGKFSVDSCRCKFQLLRNSRWLEGVSHRFTMCECRPVNTHRDGEERDRVRQPIFQCIQSAVLSFQVCDGQSENLGGKNKSNQKIGIFFKFSSGVHHQAIGLSTRSAFDFAFFLLLTME